jgi:hypothetical protein
MAQTHRKPYNSWERCGEDTRLSEFFSPEIARKLEELEKRNKREEARKEAQELGRKLLESQRNRTERHRTAQNTNTTGRPVFFWGHPAHTKPAELGGRRLVWKGHGREKSTATAPETGEKAQHQDNARPPPKETGQPRKNDRKKKKAKRHSQTGREARKSKEEHTKNKREHKNKQGGQHDKDTHTIGQTTGSNQDKTGTKTQSTEKPGQRETTNTRTPELDFIRKIGRMEKRAG